MICTSIQHKTYEEILAILPSLEMAEIRLDLCPLNDSEIEELFGQTDIPLVATCRGDAEHKLTLAIQSGARFADLEIEAPPEISRRIQKLCRECGTELIRSHHDFVGTPDDRGLQMALARCFRYGADIAKIVTTCHNADDARRINSLYSVVLENVDSLQGRLIAFGMGDAGRETRIECLRRGAPFTYAALSNTEATAPGQPVAAELARKIYGDAHTFVRQGLRMPASKSFAQRAILAAALADGTSHLSDYSPCDDSEAAIKAAEALGARIQRDGSTLTITGIGNPAGGLKLSKLDVGESGLLARLSIPVLSAINGQPFRIEGHGTLPRRPMNSAAPIMAAFGVLLTNGDDDAPTEGKREIHVPLTVRGTLIPGNAEVSGSGGSQLISGLLMALPLCSKDSSLFVNEPKSIPYMYITLDVLRHFGISTRSEMEGDAELLEAEDWSGCTGISFKVRGGQRYRAANFGIESDWSAAANFLVAGAIFGSVELEGMDMKSIQADIAIIDVLVEAGALVSQLDDGTLCVRRAPLEGFSIDLNNAPDLFPIVSVLAAFCAGESRIAGLGRLAGKESDRAVAILDMLRQMGVEAEAQGDELTVQGETWVGRLLSGRLLKGGAYTSHHDHRMAMALSVAALGADGPIEIDDTACVSKSFPDFFGTFQK
ncbi:MAG: 3-phosphoshikimate 1-carboxyvinyltransferase [Bacteroidales bacterium]|nr:3-phosphoshikimate 1-carboxyvinyltransferase [Bacteroidales bacterium]